MNEKSVFKTLDNLREARVIFHVNDPWEVCQEALVMKHPELFVTYISWSESTERNDPCAEEIFDAWVLNGEELPADKMSLAQEYFIEDHNRSRQRAGYYFQQIRSLYQVTDEGDDIAAHYMKKAIDLTVRSMKNVKRFGEMFPSEHICGLCIDSSLKDLKSFQNEILLLWESPESHYEL